MKSSHTSRKGFTLIELLVVIAIIAILAALAVPQIANALTQGQLTQSLNNGKQIHLATTRMVLDASVSPDPKLGWPGDLQDVQDIGQFAERLVDYKYFERGDLKSIFYAPGVQAYTGTGQMNSQNSAFKAYLVTANDVGQVIFLATKNFKFGQQLQTGQNIPYGVKGAVIVRKGGEGLKITDQQAIQSSNGGLGLMPGSVDQQSPGTEGNVLD